LLFFYPFIYTYSKALSLLIEDFSFNLQTGLTFGIVFALKIRIGQNPDSEEVSGNFNENFLYIDK